MNDSMNRRRQCCRILVIMLAITGMILFGCRSNPDRSGQFEGKAENGCEDGSLHLSYAHPTPVLTKHSEGAEGIHLGFEGGRVIKIDGIYHLFTSELVTIPLWVNMQLGHWTSRDRIHWKRMGTLFKSTGRMDGMDQRAALWSPMAIWDDEERVWNLFYVCYKSKPNTPDAFFLNFEGRIMRAVSTIKGTSGISGPYEDVGYILEPGPESQSWEGLQGTDSFYPWKVGDRWYAFYGSAKTGSLPVQNWRVGMAASSSLGGKWLRDPGNPSGIEDYFIENPVVTPLHGGGWVAVYDMHPGLTVFGYGYSPDGISWSKGKRLDIMDGVEGWCEDMRTPLGLVYEGDGRYTMFYTGFEEFPDWEALYELKGEASCAIGFVELEFKPDTK